MDRVMRLPTIACLGLGVVGVLCAWFQGDFWLAALLLYAVFYLGAGSVHLSEVIRKANRSPLNAGFQLYYDFLMPALLITLMSFWYLTR